MSRLFLAIDLGTSSVKAVLVDESGKETALADDDSVIHQPRPSWQEQDMEEVWNAMKKAVSRAVSNVDSKRINAISFSTAMHGMMVVDQESQPLTRMLTWADARCMEQAEQLAQELDAHDVYMRTGCPLKTLYYPARILWFRQNMPEVFKKAAKFVSIKDCIVKRLTGRLVTDRSNASSNGLLDIHDLDWNSSLLHALGISLEHLPELIDSDEPCGELKDDAAKDLSVPSGIPVIAGAGDGGLANLGSGAVEPEQAAATIGSSGAVRRIFSKPWLDPAERTWCYYLADDRWYAGGAINSGGIILNWLADRFFSEEKQGESSSAGDPFHKIFRMAESVPAGAEGLVFLPYLYGERNPYWNPNARGVLFGISPRHGKAHLARAALEGICMCMAQVLEGIRDSEGGIHEIRATGGFTRSNLWVQTMADVLGMKISIPRASQGSAMGAAILAMKAVGAIQDLAEARDMVRVEKVVEPDLEKHNLYRERLELFKSLYSSLEGYFERIVLT